VSKFEIYKRILPNLVPIIFRNVFSPVNAVIFPVVVLLFVFGDKQAGLFLGIVFVLNTLITVVQDIKARLLLEKLQALTALRVVRINNDKTETSVLADEIIKGDLLKLKLGDQAPCDGLLISAEDLEISEALITGESDSFSKREGEKVIAGAIITSGYGVMETKGRFRESRLSILAENIKKYEASPSSIQRATNSVIKYCGYILLATLVIVVVRGIFVHAPRLEIVMNAGALASTLVPQGLMVAIALLFAVGAASYSRRQVLFQEINVTEKLGRIKNLCMDKTGTLTDNILVVEDMHVFHGASKEDVNFFTSAYIRGLGESSQTILAIKKYLEKNGKQESEGEKIVGKLPFSSWRRYGAVQVMRENAMHTVVVGTPDIFLHHISNNEEKEWLQGVLKEHAQAGKRMLCVAYVNGKDLPKDLSKTRLSLMAAFVFHNTFRHGVKDAIKFFQDRGVRIRILSGDNTDTVRSVALSVGVKGAENVVTGKEIEKWTGADFEKRAREYAVFAQILPEHKLKLIEAFKKDGFTAMVGDGVNDALAMKKADLGIAMFDGAPVTRRIAGVVLMTNSFSDLPGAVELADHFIQGIEISSGIYINQAIVGLLFFIIVTALGYSYPITPLNITFMNYFTVGFSGILVAYWALRPSRKILPANDKPFLARVLPLVIYCAIIEAMGVAFIFALSPQYLKTASSNTLVCFAFIAFGYLFLFFAVKVYRGLITKKEKFHLFLLGIFELVVIYLMLQVPFFVRFFNITLPYPPLSYFMKALLVVLLFGCVQYLVVKKFFLKKNN